MVRNIETLETENLRLTQLIKKKHDEITKAEQKIRRNKELITKKTRIETIKNIETLNFIETHQQPNHLTY